MILSIDPGNVQSAFLIWNPQSQEVIAKDIVLNKKLRGMLRRSIPGILHVVIEMVQSFGMPVGKTIFETCVAIGRFKEIALKNNWEYFEVYRRDIKLHLCNSSRAKDSNVRQALIDRFGPPGVKKVPNPITYGLKKDLWSAFAVAVYFSDMQCNGLKKPSR